MTFNVVKDTQKKIFSDEFYIFTNCLDLILTTALIKGILPKPIQKKSLTLGQGNEHT